MSRSLDEAGMLSMDAALAMVNSVTIGGCKPALLFVVGVAGMLPPSSSVCSPVCVAEGKSEDIIDEFGVAP